jgi:hypothetical protein
MVVPVTTIGSGTVPRRMAGTVAGHDMEPIPWVIVIETRYKYNHPSGSRAAFILLKKARTASSSSIGDDIRSPVNCCSTLS